MSLQKKINQIIWIQKITQKLRETLSCSVTTSGNAFPKHPILLNEFCLLELSRHRRRGLLKDLLRQYQFTMICLLETHSSGNKAVNMAEKK